MSEQAPQDAAELQRKIEELSAQLMQAQKMSSVGALASSITHEFNNILTTIINYAKMGVRHKDEATRDKAFDKIMAASQRAAKITTGMLSYARCGGDRKEPADLVQLVQDVVVLVEKDLQKHRISLHTEFNTHPWSSVNASQIQQVLLNLIINGRQAMEPGGSLSLIVSEDDAQKFAEITVRDTGTGIPKEYLKKIFDPFFTTKEADANGQGGTGIGLAMCKDVIEDHHGRIRVESVPGKGTTFTLKFPLVPAPALRTAG